MHMLATVAVIVAAFFSSLTLYVALAQSKYVYYPDRHIAATPAMVGLAFEVLAIGTEDGETLQAWFVPCLTDGAPAKRTILFCHGNAGNIGDRVGSLATFHRLGFNVLIFDYRGYGESSGAPTEAGTYKDALACWDYLVDQRGTLPEDIVVFGRSLGGAVASWIAAHADPGALVLESVFASAPEMAAMLFPFLPIRLFCRFKYDNKRVIANVHCPVLVAHSRDDHTCPYDQGFAVYEAAHEPKQFVEISGDHNDGGLDSNPEYQDALVQFLTRGGTCQGTPEDYAGVKRGNPNAGHSESGAYGSSPHSPSGRANAGEAREVSDKISAIDGEPKREGL